MAKEPKSRWRAVGKLEGSDRTRFTVGGSIQPGCAAMIAMDFVAAWQESMAEHGHTGKGGKKPRPSQIVITINL